MTVLRFELDGRGHAIPLERVREVVRAAAVTPLPGAPPVVEGVLNVRGSVVPVLDVRRRFGYPERPLRPDDHLVVAVARQRAVILRADTATGILEVEDDRIEAAPRFAAGRELVAGVAKLEDGLVLIHDLDAFLSEAEAASLDAAIAREL